MKFRTLLKKISERSRLVQGFALGLGLTSLLTWAITVPLTLTPITDGDPLDASVVMGNFTQLQNAVNDINKGFTVSLVSNFPMTCGGSKSASPGDMVPVSGGAYIIDRNDGGLNNSTGTYTVPSGAAGAYHFFGEMPAVSSAMIDRQIFINGVVWDYPSSAGYTKVKKLFAGDTVLLKVGCGTKAGSSANLDSTGFVFGMKKL